MVVGVGVIQLPSQRECAATQLLHDERVTPGTLRRAECRLHCHGRTRLEFRPDHDSEEVLSSPRIPVISLGDVKHWSTVTRYVTLVVRTIDPGKDIH